jgi:hypothetical protein
MATLTQTKQANNFYTITVTADIDMMSYIRTYTAATPETDDVVLLLVYGHKNGWYWREDNIYENLNEKAKALLTEKELESIDPDILEELMEMLQDELRYLIPACAETITITKNGNEYKLDVTDDDIRKIFLSNT